MAKKPKASPSIETIECNSSSGSKLLGITQQYFNQVVRDGWIKPLAQNLTQLGEIGLQALSYLKSGVVAPRDWRETTMARLEEAAKPHSALEFVVVSGVKELVLASSELKR